MATTDSHDGPAPTVTSDPKVIHPINTHVSNTPAPSSRQAQINGESPSEYMPSPDSATTGPRSRGRNYFSERHGSSLIFPSRGYQELYDERAYLSSALQWQSKRSADMIRQFSAIEANLDDVEIPKQRRRLRKKLSLLRAGMNNAACQERALLIRLSEVHIELRNREQWDQVRLETIIMAAARCNASDGSSYYSPSPVSCFSDDSSAATVATPLNGASPGFVPRKLSVDPSACVSVGRLAKVDEEEDTLCNHGLEYAYSCDKADKDRDGCRKGSNRISWIDADVVSPREKRLSLPSLHSMWP